MGQKTSPINEKTTDKENVNFTDRLKEGVNRLSNIIRGEKITIDTIFPYKNITREGFLVHKDGGYQALLKVRTYDLQSMNDNDLNQLIQAFQRILQVYIEPIKLTTMSYPTETGVQQSFYEQKIKQYEQILAEGNLNERQYQAYQNKRLRALEEHQRMEWAEENLKDLAFFMVVFGDNAEELTNNIRKIQRLGKMHFGLDHITNERITINYIRKLMNMNMEL